MGESLWGQNLKPNSEAGLRGRHKEDEMINVRHARLSLREAADVLRTDRRTGGKNQKRRYRKKCSYCIK